MLGEWNKFPWWEVVEIAPEFHAGKPVADVGKNIQIQIQIQIKKYK